VLAAAAAFAQPIQVSSLDDALELGRQRALVIQESAKEVEVSQHSLTRTRSLFMPKAHLEFAGVRREAVFELPPGSELALDKDPGFFFGYEKEWAARIRVDQPVYAGHRNINRRRMARLSLDLESERHQLTQLDLDVEITRAYYTVLLANEVLDIKKDLIEQNRQHAADVARRLDAGEVARFDKLRADVQLANLYPELVSARNAVDVATAQLKNVLGLRQEEQITVSGTIEYAPEDVSIPEALREALENRPEIRMIRFERQITERTRAIAWGRLVPALGAYVAQDFRAPSLGDLTEDIHRGYTYGVTLSVPIFDGGDAAGQAREERSRVERAEIAEERLVRDIEVEVIETALELRRAAEVIESQKLNVRQAEEALQIAYTSYDGGLITNLELMDTQLALDQARINYITAVYDYLMGQARYRRALAR
jgi:outer membrane protein TolC